MIQLSLQFHEQIQHQLRSRLARSGVSIDAALPPVDVAIRYFDYKRRVLPQRARKVFISRELASTTLATDLQVGLDCIVADLHSGCALGPFFSRQWLNLESNDILFNDWRVRHMHLGGRKLDSDGFVQRTKPVLFVYLTRQEAYLIDVMEHGKTNPTVFAETRIVEILNANWPHIIDHARAPGVSELYPNDTHSRWFLSRRKKGPRLSLGVEASDGPVFTSIGGGYMMDGRSGNAVQCAFELMNAGTRWAERCSTKMRLILDELGKQLGERPTNVDLEFSLAPLQWGVEYRVTDRISRVGIGRGARILLPEYERR